MTPRRPGKIGHLLALLLTATLWASSPVAAQEPERTMVMPVTAKNAETAQHLAEFTAQLREYFGKNPRVVMLGDDQLQALLDAATGTNRELVQVAGEKLGCRSALLITLERYRERLGDEYSATDPASLAFEFRLVNIADGQVVCFGQFDETQQAVSENILAIGRAFTRGFKWITVADLTREALPRKFTGCPELVSPEP